MSRRWIHSALAPIVLAGAILAGCAGPVTTGTPTPAPTAGTAVTTTGATAEPDPDPDAVVVTLTYSVSTVAGLRGRSTATLYGDGTVERVDAEGEASTITLAAGDLAAARAGLEVLAAAPEISSHISDSGVMAFEITRDGAPVSVSVDDWPASMIGDLPADDRTVVQAAHDIRNLLLASVTATTSASTG